MKTIEEKGQEVKNVFDDYLSTYLPTKMKRIMTCHVTLTKNQILDVLKHDFVKIHEKTYYTPTHELKMCLLNNKYGSIELEFEEVSEDC